MASKRIVFAVNCNAKGRVHRVTHGTAKLPRDRQLVHCGWRITKSVSRVYYACSKDVDKSSVDKSRMQVVEEEHCEHRERRLDGMSSHGDLPKNMVQC